MTATDPPALPSAKPMAGRATSALPLFTPHIAKQ